MKTKLTQEDIDKIRNSAVIMASEKDKQMILNKISKDKGLGYMTMSNGYLVNMIIDATKKNKFRYLLSTYNPSGDINPEISKMIAHDVIGDGYTILSGKGNFIDFTKEEEKHINQNERLTREDIKKARKSIVVLTDNNVASMILGGGLRPVILSNWYKTTLSADVIRENLRLIHLSISNTLGKTDSKIAENMALDIVGEGFETVGPMYYPNAIHFMKVENEKTMVELFSNMGEKDIKGGNINKDTKGGNINKDTKGGNINKDIKGGNINKDIKGGNINKEGDINNGNERGVKKEIQIEDIVERPNREWKNIFSS